MGFWLIFEKSTFAGTCQHSSKVEYKCSIIRDRLACIGVLNNIIKIITVNGWIVIICMMVFVCKTKSCFNQCLTGTNINLMMMSIYFHAPYDAMVHITKVQRKIFRCFVHFFFILSLFTLRRFSYQKALAQ